MFVRAFDQPAFRMPFQQESNLRAFQQAIDDTIRVLSTGIWQTREGAESTDFPRFTTSAMPASAAPWN